MKLKGFVFHVRKNEDESRDKGIYITSKHLNGAVKKLFNVIDTNEEHLVSFEQLY